MTKTTIFHLQYLEKVEVTLLEPPNKLGGPVGNQGFWMGRHKGKNLTNLVTKSINKVFKKDEPSFVIRMVKKLGHRKM